jgi:hypothetical protein
MIILPILSGKDVLPSKGHGGTPGIGLARTLPDKLQEGSAESA